MDNPRQSPVAHAAGRAAWQVADLVRAEIDSGSTTDAIRFVVDRLAMHIASGHIGDADDCNLCTQATWKECMKTMAAR